MADIKETVTVIGEDTNITRKKVEILNGKLHLLDLCF